MKGIETVISAILVLMIVVALAALAYSWFSRLFGEVTRAVATAVGRGAAVMATQFKIEAAKFNTTSNKVNAVIRNTGSQSFNASKEMLAAYIGDTYSIIDDVDIASPYILMQGDLTKLTISNSTEACNNYLRITIETGLSDSRIISC